MDSIRLTLYFKAGGFAIPSIFLDIRKTLSYHNKTFPHIFHFFEQIFYFSQIKACIFRIFIVFL